MFSVAIHPPKFNSSPLKNDGWKITVLSGWLIFRGYVKLPESNLNLGPSRNSWTSYHQGHVVTAQATLLTIKKHTDFSTQNEVDLSPFFHKEKSMINTYCCCGKKMKANRCIKCIILFSLEKTNHYIVVRGINSV